jgi:hypothetical protein
MPRARAACGAPSLPARRPCGRSAGSQAAPVPAAARASASGTAGACSISGTRARDISGMACWSTRGSSGADGDFCRRAILLREHRPSGVLLISTDTPSTQTIMTLRRSGVSGNIDVAAGESFPALPGDVADLAEGVVAISVPGNCGDGGIAMRVAGWAGSGAGDRRDFSARCVLLAWLVSGLFGSTSDPTSGVLPKITDAVAQARMNYGAAGDMITTSLKDHVAGLSAAAGGSERLVTRPPGVRLAARSWRACADDAVRRGAGACLARAALRAPGGPAMLPGGVAGVAPEPQLGCPGPAGALGGAAG